MRLPTTCLVALPLGSVLATAQEPTENHLLAETTHKPQPTIASPSTHKRLSVGPSVGPQVPRWVQKHPSQTIFRTSLDIAPAAPHVPRNRERSLANSRCLALSLSLSPRLANCNLFLPIWPEGDALGEGGRPEGINHGARCEPQSEGGLKRCLN